MDSKKEKTPTTASDVLPDATMVYPRKSREYDSKNGGGERDNHRDDPRHVRRNGHQGKGKEGKEEEGESSNQIETSVVVLSSGDDSEKESTTTTKAFDDSDKEAKVPLPPNAIETRLPSDWTPSTRDQEVAAKFGMSPQEIESELLVFHALNTERGTFSLNWSATWVRFCKAWAQLNLKSAKEPPRIEVSTIAAFKPMPQQWHRQVELWIKDNSRWSRQFGPEPGMINCRCPKVILTAQGIDPDTGLRIRTAAPSTESDSK